MKTAIQYTFVAALIGLGLHLQAASTIEFTANTYTVAENAGAMTLTVQRQGDFNTEGSVDYASADGTGTNGLKYTAVAGILAFRAGETNKTIVVPILNEGFVEGSTTFQVALSNPTRGAVLGVRTNAMVTIKDNDVGIQFQFSYSVAEDAGQVLIGVVRGDDGTLPVTVDFATADLSATNGVDYVGATNTLSFAPQERLKFVPVTIINNSLKQSNRTFSATLSNPTGGTLGLTKSLRVGIVDNDQGFQLDSARYTVAEDAGVALISVLRGTDDTNSAVTVDLATSDGLATNGLNYAGFTNTLSFAPGERVKRITVPILNNGIKQTTKEFRLTLANPTGGGVLGSPTTATVSILDNDPGVGFERTSYTNGWGDEGGITLTVLRGNDWALGPFTVDYVTRDGTARAGQDYQAVTGTLTFQENEMLKTLTIPLLRNRAAEDTKRFLVALSHPTGGATLGNASTTVDIVGAYFTLAPPFDSALNIRHDLGVNTLAWAGGGLLQRADRLTGPWQTLTTARSPFTVQSVTPSAFFRVTRPRPVNLYVPSGYDGQSPMPLVILLHGLSYTGDTQESYMMFRPLVEKRRFLYCYPDGTINQLGYNFWNGTEACCDFWNTGVDDAGYLKDLIEEIARRFAVDRKQIYLVGYSNGGFMAYRMACEFADLIAGIATLGASTFLESARYAPSERVNVLHIHGTDDGVVPYYGGMVNIVGVPKMLPMPGAEKSVQIWAGYNGSSGAITETAPSLDLTSDVAGLDTVVTRYTNCPPGGAVELWTINRGSHGPTLSSEFSTRVIDWLLAHPKP